MREPFKMTCRLLAAAAVATLLASPPERALAEQAPSDPVAELRREIELLKAQVQELRQKLESLAPTPASVPEPVAEVEPAPPAQPAPASAAPPSQSAGAFNPAISAVFQGIGNASVNHDRDDDGFSLSEAEIGLQAAVDPYARVDLFLSFGAEGEAEVEEGFATLVALPGGLQLKGGRFKSAFGKWNTLHNHAFFTVDRPDVLTSFFGEESLTGDGGSLSWLIPGTGSVYLESITEVSSTSNDVSFNAAGRDPLFLQHLGSVFTLTPNATLEAGATAAAGKAGASSHLVDAIDAAGLSGTLTPADNLSSNVFGADLTYKWKPLQRNLYRSFLWQGEILASRRRAERLDPGGFLERSTLRSFGGYSYAEYQFAKRLRGGLRYDATGLPDVEDARQRAISAVLRIQPTEFQEFRIQFRHTGRNATAAEIFDDVASDNEVFIEWIPVIGAHAAHKY
ncbi:MAG TPA: hypothetical protein VFG76_05695 [Candidatus Polarisedimenticolia bacterium]|nr:hypothetical protein [Candidatus Polarisedimenticolia bacterium]